jgi:hypothetical protein
LRDEVLPYLGIQLEDKKPGEAATWKFVDKDELIKEIEAKKQAKLQKEAEKVARAELELKKKSTSGADWFKVFESATYSKYDEAGLPTHDIKDKELPEAKRNGLKKLQTKQQGVYEKWVASQATAGDVKEESKE